MQIFKGVNALPEFRAKQLTKQIKIINPSIKSISAEYLHFVDTKKNLSGRQADILKNLLSYGSRFEGKNTKDQIIIVPRFGTISAWASKATDIALSSGLKMVNRIERGVAYYIESETNTDFKSIAALLHDRMIETVIYDASDAAKLFNVDNAQTYQEIDISQGDKSLYEANLAMGLALSKDEIEYLYRSYTAIGRNPSDTELMMFSVVNSEHCRHKIFNALWQIDGKKQPKSLFKHIKNTYEKNSENVLSAYSDNAAVLKGPTTNRFYPDPKTGAYKYTNEPAHLVTKVETHNHPTAVAPAPGAATGVGGEIRDESATGRGAKSKMGLSGFSVSNLNIPNNILPWEKPFGKPGRIASALDIMIEAPIGGAAFNNEFGRPNLAGYFRTYEQENNDQVWGYHKPIMIAGGAGNIKDEHVDKLTMKPGTLLVVLGGPSMLIGLGGGTASSMQTGESEENLDFASVQRANPEIERRAQEVINSCWEMGKNNPIVTIHDVGAGGLSNAMPELVNDSNLGAKFELRDIPSAEPGMSPMEIWCNEAQERYVMGIDKKNIERFKVLCERERCPYAVIGVATKEKNLILNDSKFKNKPVNIPLELLFGNPPKMTRSYETKRIKKQILNLSNVKIADAAERVMKMPSVGSKKFLITIGDRSVGGLTVRDQMVGPWQVPVSDVAVTASSYGSKTGEAMAMGERSPVAMINSAASARISLGEAITNLAAAKIQKISDIKFSANWMAAAGYENEDQQLYEAVKALGDEFCPQLGVTIPVGKDSLSMRTSWEENKTEKSVTSPLSVVISGFAPVKDNSKTLTPLIEDQDSVLILVDLGNQKNRLGGSALAQAYSQVGSTSPDITANNLKSFFNSIQKLNEDGLILAYHDRSDGGLFATVSEMMFASRLGITLNISDLGEDQLAILFNEELGAVVQVKKADAEKVLKTLGNNSHAIGEVQKNQKLTIKYGSKTIYQNTRKQLEEWWSSTSYNIQSLRDNPECAKQENETIQDDTDPGISPKVNFEIEKPTYPSRPKVAVFRDQGVNGQVEMAAAFDRAGFESIDVHLNDLLSGRFSLNNFSVLATCGGFSFGDVLGAGGGWAKSILNSQQLRKDFKNFFARKDTLSLGICNGCQMLSGLKEIIPGAEHWPKFKKNISEQFEARLVSVKVNKTNSVFFNEMEGSTLPIHVAHGEGRAVFENKIDKSLVSLQYVDNFGSVTKRYPYNPNGSDGSVAAVTSKDGRATIAMPHPERGFMSYQYSWHLKEWGEEAPLFKIFLNARKWIEENSKN